MNKLPKLTEEERNAAFERAMQVRRGRAMLKSRLKSGTVSVEEAMGEDCAQKMRVTQFIKSIPSVGDAKAKSLMLELGIPQNRTVGGLGCRQREQLIAKGEEYRSRAVH